jgi:hypothetical protein
MTMQGLYPQFVSIDCRKRISNQACMPTPLCSPEKSPEQDSTVFYCPHAV